MKAPAPLSIIASLTRPLFHQILTLTLIGLCLAVAAWIGAPSPGIAVEQVSETPQALAEANRLLEEELKVAARPQIYVIMDLSRNLILVKGRGLELYRLPIADWHLSRGGSLQGIFRLQSRPPVSRPTAGPATENLPPVIELKDMPREFTLVFAPSLLVAVAPPAREQPWLWAKSFLRDWWSRIKLIAGLGTSDEPANGPRLRLTLSQEAAQSLAWTVTEGMPVLIGRPAAS